MDDAVYLRFTCLRDMMFFELVLKKRKPAGERFATMRVLGMKSNFSLTVCGGLLSFADPFFILL